MSMRQKGLKLLSQRGARRRGRTGDGFGSRCSSIAQPSTLSSKEASVIWKKEEGEVGISQRGPWQMLVEERTEIGPSCSVLVQPETTSVRAS